MPRAASPSAVRTMKDCSVPRRRRVPPPARPWRNRYGRLSIPCVVQLPRCCHDGALVLTATAASAQRLPATVTPVHYDITVSPRLADGEVQRTEAIKLRVSAATSKIVLNAAEITFESVSISAGGRQQRAVVTLDAAKEQATFIVPEPRAGRRRRHHHRLQRHPQRRPARPVSEQSEQPPLRGHAARGDRRAADVSRRSTSPPSRRRSR